MLSFLAVHGGQSVDEHVQREDHRKDLARPMSALRSNDWSRLATAASDVCGQIELRRCFSCKCVAGNTCSAFIEAQ